MDTQIYFPNPKGHSHVQSYMTYVLGVPDKDAAILAQNASRCEVDLGSGAVLVGYAVGQNLFVSPVFEYTHHYDSRQACWHIPNAKPSDVPFFSAEVLTSAYTKQVQKEVRGRDSWLHRTPVQTITVDDHYGSDNQGRILRWQYLRIRVSAPGAADQEVEFKFRMNECGVARLSSDPASALVTVEADFFGATQTWQDSIKPFSYMKKGVESWQSAQGHVTGGLAILHKHFNGSVLPEGKDAWWARFLAHNGESDDAQTDEKGIKAAYKKHGPALATLKASDPTGYAFFRWLHDGRTKDKTSNNALLATFLDATGDVQKMQAALAHTRNEVFQTLPTPNTPYEVNVGDTWQETIRALCLSLPGAGDKKQEAEAKADWTKRRDQAGQADGLGITADKFPLLYQAVVDSKIPTTVFYQPGPKDKKEPVNVEFPLWERALAQPGWADIICEIAQDAARRSTYERDLTPYLNFLFRLPKYLDRHAPGEGKWKTVPKFVKAEWELEMNDDASENGTVKRRSAFTPVADNENLTVTVPYVAVSVSGVRTQWCYARYFHLFEEGMTDPISGGIVLNDFETKLNGRDDYGLCFYTLNGTATAQGYPTFLIIFERLQDKTRVHFHRVRPCRSKDGITTPACKLVEACYQYMAGNIPADEVVAQQGDLIFLKCTTDPRTSGAKVKPPQPVSVFESHRFVPINGTPVMLLESEAKTPKNRLGYVMSPGGFAVRHPEHEDIEHLPDTFYEVRRAKSWEANPKAIWSLTID